MKLKGECGVDEELGCFLRRRRPTLAPASDPETSLEKHMSAETVEAIDSYWMMFWRRTGAPPVVLLCNRDGKPKSAAAFPNGVAKFGRAIDVSLTPQLLRIAVVAAMFEAKAKPDDIAATLGIKQLVNLESRFKAFIDEDAAEQMADEITSETHDGEDA